MSNIGYRENYCRVPGEEVLIRQERIIDAFVDAASIDIVMGREVYPTKHRIFSSRQVPAMLSEPRRTQLEKFTLGDRSEHC